MNKKNEINKSKNSKKNNNLGKIKKNILDLPKGINEENIQLLEKYINMIRKINKDKKLYNVKDIAEMIYSTIIDKSQGTNIIIDLSNKTSSINTIGSIIDMFWMFVLKICIVPESTIKIRNIGSFKSRIAKPKKFKDINNKECITEERKTFTMKKSGFIRQILNMLKK